MLTPISHKRTILLYPDEDGYIIAEVPSLPGCISQGETKKEALENIQEAINLHIEVLRERGELIPEDNIEVTAIVYE
ncbi:type II toxin-antitoxin system HicB family antitoxin [Crocosphaera sp. XPORK-15E]|uniref:type II toxin-antitoxin system HicB family antitoxin n=1 Tax=Crocosphaera sp. XPORK-15E TaxID=3110247 RepID=UPI002B1E9144|nr:type II toxin-antitoxin system HicB family antitoxin [Crocosphaera sp. XPORK-15E]MEA5534321.1 type II toxin-antitoxin system HicB family antitoxin [Crocosphaera sp. XPORK-15E]